MEIKISDGVTFKYKTLLSECYKANKLPMIKKGLYGFPLTKKTVSNEHLIPYSECHDSSLGNIALANKHINNLRGCKPLKEFLTKTMLNDYLNQFKDVKVKHKGRIFDGNKYKEDVLENVKHLDLRG